jgi:hypothetical protein
VARKPARAHRADGEAARALLDDLDADLQPVLARLIRRALAALERELPVVAIVRALARRSVREVLDLLPTEALDQLEEAIVREAEPRALVAARRAIKTLRERQREIAQGFAMGRIPLSPLVREAIRTQVGDLIRSIDEETRRAVRRLLERQLAKGLHPRAIARTLGERVGLTPRQLARLDAVEAQLIEQGVGARARSQTLARLASRMRAIRGEVIARTESMRALNAGQRAGWEALQQAGVIRHGDLREWVAVVPTDGRTCPICLSLDGHRVAVGEPFPGGLVGPPAHPQCRCVERMILG